MPGTGPTGPGDGADRAVPLPVLRTARLTVRRMEPPDAVALATYRSDPQVARYQGWDVPFTPAQARALVAESAAAQALPDVWVQLAVVDRASGTLVGDLAVHVEDHGRQARVGVTLARAHQGRGYATEALGALLDHLLGPAGLHRVVADCDARNNASARLLERVGMRREAHHRSAAWWKGEWTDELVFAVLANERPSAGG